MNRGNALMLLSLNLAALGLLLVPCHLLLDFLLCCGCLQLQAWWKMATLLLPLFHVVLFDCLCHWKCRITVGMSSVSQVT